ncbi:MAG: diacylglycerol kinase family lipid kinase [Deltaproteobacteria bacterium]|nr:diacylglycerol kinase family lipid kinase [Deltaproteobacteria bacterium]
MKDVCFILNPASRRGHSFLSRLRKFLALRFPQAELVLTEAPGHATFLAREAGERGCHRLFSVGGDGTLNEVINGVMALPEERRPAVGVLASGTGGDFPRRLREIAQFPTDFSWVLDPQHRRIDLGRAWIGRRGEETFRYFINIADAGIAGEVVRRVNASRKFFGPLEYFRATFTAGWSYRPPRVKVSQTLSDGSVHQEEISLMMALAANSRYFGGGMCVAPEAQFDDGSLFFLVAEEMSYFTLLLQLRHVYRRRKMKHPKIHYREGTRMEIEALTGDLAIDLDGEYFRCPRICFEIVPLALDILVPSNASPGYDKGNVE